MIPLTTLLPVDMREHLRAYMTQSQAVINRRKARPPVTAAEVAEVVDLHERMYHPSLECRHGTLSAVRCVARSGHGTYHRGAGVQPSGLPVLRAEQDEAD